MILPFNQFISLLATHKIKQAPKKALWWWNGADATYPYSLTPEGKKLFGVRERRITTQRFLQLRNDLYNQVFTEEVSPVISRFLDGETTSRVMVNTVRRILKRTYLMNYQLARGGRQEMSFRDYGRLGAQLRMEYAYLNRFMEDLESKTFSAEQLSSRFQLYFKGSVRSFELGQATAWGLEPNAIWRNQVLPVIPGAANYSKPGELGCEGTCFCNWAYKIEEREIWAYWMLDPNVGKHCSNCLRNSEEWNPLRIARAYDDRL